MWRTKTGLSPLPESPHCSELQGIFTDNITQLHHCIETQRGKGNCPWSHNRAGTRTLNLSLGLREKEASRLKCLGESDKKRKHMASPGTIGWPQRGHAHVHLDTQVHGYIFTRRHPPGAQAYGHTCTWTWLLTSFSFSCWRAE